MGLAGAAATIMAGARTAMPHAAGASTACGAGAYPMMAPLTGAFCAKHAGAATWAAAAGCGCQGVMALVGDGSGLRSTGVDGLTRANVMLTRRLDDGHTTWRAMSALLPRMTRRDLQIFGSVNSMTHDHVFGNIKIISLCFILDMIK